MNDVELRWKEINSFFKPEDVKVNKWSSLYKSRNSITWLK